MWLVARPNGIEIVFAIFTQNKRGGCPDYFKTHKSILQPKFAEIRALKVWKYEENHSKVISYIYAVEVVGNKFEYYNK